MTRTFQSRRFALISCVVVLGLSSCGSRAQITSAKKPAVIHVGAQVNDTANADAANDTSFAGSEAKIAAPSTITYVYSGDDVDLTAPAGSWFFGPGKAPSKDVIKALAAALRITGEVVDVPTDQGGGWRVGSADYTQPSLTVSNDALHSWWYNPGSTIEPQIACAYDTSASGSPTGGPAVDVAADPVPVPETSVAEISAPVAEPLVDPADVAPVDPAESFVNPCPAPEPPANVPSKDQAETKARQFFSSIGVNVDNMVFETYADEWGASVTGFLVLDGIRTTVSVSIGYGAEGATTWSSGYLATPERGGDYPRVGIDAAITRLNEQATWMYASTRGGIAVDQVVEPAGTAVATQVATDVATESSIADQAEPNQPIEPSPPVECGPAVDCVAIDPQPITITLSNAHPTLEQIWAADGTIWLVPGYGFDSAEQGIYSVIAIDDSFIDVEQPIAVDAPVPLPVPTDPAVSAPAAGTDCAVASWSASPTPEEFSKGLVGLCLDAAVLDAPTLGYEVRVARQDGEDLVVTDDLRENRFNVAVENGVITEVLFIG